MTRRSFELTPRRKKILRFIASYTAEHTQPPSLAEIALHIGVRPSAGGLKSHLLVLESMGFLTWSRGETRTLRLLKAVP